VKVIVHQQNTGPFNKHFCTVENNKKGKLSRIQHKTHKFRNKIESNINPMTINQSIDPIHITSKRWIGWIEEERIDLQQGMQEEED